MHVSLVCVTVAWRVELSAPCSWYGTRDTTRDYDTTVNDGTLNTLDGKAGRHTSHVGTRQMVRGWPGKSARPTTIGSAPS